jgi:hypothetical protein
MSAKCQKQTSLTTSIFAPCSRAGEAGPALTTQVKGVSQESYEKFRAASTAFRPPNANEFDIAASIRMARASFGT